MPKRTIENCTLIKIAVSEGLGKCNVIDGKCECYSSELEDEPCSTCKRCKLNVAYEE